MLEQFGLKNNLVTWAVIAGVAYWVYCKYYMTPATTPTTTTTTTTPVAQSTTPTPTTGAAGIGAFPQRRRLMGLGRVQSPFRDGYEFENGYAHASNAGPYSGTGPY